MTATAIAGSTGLLRDPNTGALVVSGLSSVSVKGFGAAGDGTTDDTAAIQAAVNVLSSGGTLFFPHGTYKLTSAISFSLGDVEVVGERGTTLVLAAGSNSNVLRFNPSADTATAGVVRQSRILLRDLLIDMQGSTQGNVSGGTDGCIVAPAVDFFQADNVQVRNSKNTAFELRGSSIVRLRGCTVNGVLFGNNANGFNLGKTGQAAGGDYVLEGCVVTGCQDVAIWLGGDGGHRLTAHGCIVRGDWATILTDGAITSGSASFTSASAAFTKKDEGKTITVNGAGPAGAALTVRIAAFTSATAVTLSTNASTTVSGATFSYGADNAPAKRVADAAITSGQATLTSATAGFSASDVGKGVYILGAGAGGSNLKSRITAFTNSTTVTIQVSAGTTVSGAVAIVGSTNSGVVSEGSSGNSDHGSIMGCHVVGTVNVGIGGTDASAGTVGPKHDLFSIVGNTIADAYGTALWVTGTNFALAANVIDNFHEAGVLLGAGNDFDERGFSYIGGSIVAAADATGKALTIQKDGALTNWMQNVTVIGTVIDGNNAASRGVSIEGKVRIVALHGVEVSRCKQSGLVTIAKSGASPSDVKIIGGDYRNNNQGGNGTGVNSVGINIDASTDKVRIVGATATDDQASKTQTHGLRWASGATRGHITDCDFVGNATGPSTSTFDANTVYKNNRDVDAAYEGTATLSGGVVTVSTAAARNSGASNWGLIEVQVVTPGGTQGALFVDQITTGTSFRIRSTSATDTSVVKWRIT